MSDTVLEISIPADNDGYVLFQCSICGEYFKITPSDYKDDRILDIHCPCCGLFSDSYFTDDVLELAYAKTKNVAIDMLYNEIKKHEFESSFLSFKVGKKPERKTENPVRVGIEALVITRFACCERNAKIKQALRITGCYCPFCGVKEYDIE